MSRKITIDPVTRVEGHGKVTININDQNQVTDSYLHIVEFRGFERFIQGRPYWEAPVLVQRLCGICPVSHHLCAAKALDEIVGVNQQDLTPTAYKMRKLMHYGQVLQSHALHFFYLAAPDLLLGIDSKPETRNIVGIAAAHPELAKKGILIRKFGQEIIKATAGKKIHGISAVPGGVHKNLSTQERDLFFAGGDVPSVSQIIDWCEEILAFYKGYHKKNKSQIDGFSSFESNHMSLLGPDDGMELYHGNLNVMNAAGKFIMHQADYHQYSEFLAEDVKPWSYMKFPYLKKLGVEKGWSRVGPLARINTCSHIPTPKAQAEFELIKAYTNGKPNSMCLHYHWARLIEMLHCTEVIEGLLKDDDLQKNELIVKGKRQNEGISFIEAPRGTLIHHYEVDESDKISRCNLIVSTTHNNVPMNQSIKNVAQRRINGHAEVTEGMLNEVEVAIRAYDPCLSCATHAIGKMPLHLSLYNQQNQLIKEIFKSINS